MILLLEYRAATPLVNDQVLGRHDVRCHPSEHPLPPRPPRTSTQVPTMWRTLNS